MALPAPMTSPADQIAPGEQRIILHDVSWEQYVTVRDALDHLPLRMTYLEGALEIMSPSREHEGIKTTLARLLEIHALERGIDLNGYGSTTFRKRARKRGVEPDECYSIGPMKAVPALAIEVVLSHGGIDRLKVYRGLGVPEVWLWQDGVLTMFALDADGYVPIERSRLLPDLDVIELLRFLLPDDQTAAVRAYREALRR